jgi:hypothetical protein
VLTLKTVRFVIFIVICYCYLFPAYEKGQTNQYTVAINFGLSWFYETCEITLMWIPGHKGIPLNEIADETARIARQLPEGVAFVDRRHFIINQGFDMNAVISPLVFRKRSLVPVVYLVEENTLVAAKPFGPFALSAGQ